MGVQVFLAALIAPFCYALTNHIDKHLLERYFKEGGVETLLLVSSLLTLVSLPILYYFDPSVLQIGWFELMIMALVGLLNVVLLWAYFQAMSQEEPTVVIIFYQLVPVFGLVLGNIFLGEVITEQQGWAMVLILLGGLVMSFVLDGDGKFEFRWKTVVCMLIASLCWAAESTLFKKVALDETVVRSLFWEAASITFIGILIFIFKKKYRDSFLNAMRNNSVPVMGLNVANEAIYLVGNAGASAVGILIPVALNLMMNSFQPFFVFLIGVLLGKLLPQWATESSGDRLTQKILAIILTGFGVHLLGVVV